MLFWEAMRALEEGKKVRAITDPENHYIIKILDEVILYAQGNTYNKSNSPLGFTILQEWELFEEPELLLSFTQVVEGLKQGKAFGRKGWLSQEYSIKLYQCGIMNSHSSSPWFAYPEDFEATDWIEVK